REHAIEAIIILLGDGIVFMIMAAGTGDGKAKKPACCGIDLVIYLIVRIVIEETAEGQEAEGRETPAREFWVNQIGGELVLNKLVKGQVLIEGADHIIPVGISVGAQSIFAICQNEIFRIGVASDVEPMSAPAFAVAGGGEEPFDDVCECA